MSPVEGSGDVRAGASVAHQPRAAGRTALGRVVRRRAGALGHRRAPAGGRAPGRRRRVRRAGPRRRLRHRRERPPPRRSGAERAGRRRGPDGGGARHARRPQRAGWTSGSRSRRRPATWVVSAGCSRRCSTAGCSTPSTATSGATTWPAWRPSPVPAVGCTCCASATWGRSGPHPVSEQDLRAAFPDSSGWRVEALRPERCLTRFHGEAGAPAWLATLRRLEAGGAGA